MKKLSLIIPTFNEEKLIAKCLKSLKGQSYQDMEIIVVDDGSKDKSLKIISSLKSEISNLKLLQQKHKGPGTARNLGASKASGEILVFVDADMTFDRDFLKDLVDPILKGKAIGTFSKNEMVQNQDDIWSICWNINKNLPKDRMIPKSYPNQAPVFRAILKKEFDKVEGFETTGQYTDDWSLSRKLGVKSKAAKGAIYFHTNPSSLGEIWTQARWIGKNEFISGNIIRQLKSILVYNPLTSILIALYKSFVNGNFYFIIFKFTYDLAVLVSIIKSIFKEAKSK